MFIFQSSEIKYYHNFIYGSRFITLHKFMFLSVILYRETILCCIKYSSPIHYLLYFNLVTMQYYCLNLIFLLIMPLLKKNIIYRSTNIHIIYNCDVFPTICISYFFNRNKYSFCYIFFQWLGCLSYHIYAYQFIFKMIHLSWNNNACVSIKIQPNKISLNISFI